MISFGKAFKGDKVIWCIFVLLCVISFLEIFSATSTIVYKQQNFMMPILRHLAFLVAGLGIAMLFQGISYRFFALIMVLGIPLSVILLIVTFFLGEDVNGAQRWLSIGIFTIQPSEIAKISMIVFFAFILSRRTEDNEATLFKWMLGCLGGMCLLIAPENLSTACLLFLVCFLMMFIGQISMMRLLKVGGAIAAAGILIILLLKIMPDSSNDYMPDRLATWKGRIERHGGSSGVESDSLKYVITDENYQVAHAKIAIARGGIIGLPGSGVQRDFLPQAYSDFIYAIILEEMGLAGGLFVLMLYLALLIRSGILASRCERKFPRYLILGAALMLTIQALVNMAVAVNLIPVTGQPLPLVSRGGTSTIITCLYFGIILACSAKQTDEEYADEEEDVDADGNEIEEIKSEEEGKYE